MFAFEQTAFSKMKKRRPTLNAFAVKNRKKGFEGWKRHSTRHATALTAAAQYAFKISMIH